MRVDHQSFTENVSELQLRESKLEDVFFLEFWFQGYANKKQKCSELYALV